MILVRCGLLRCTVTAIIKHFQTVIRTRLNPAMRRHMKFISFARVNMFLLLYFSATYWTVQRILVLKNTTASTYIV